MKMNGVCTTSTCLQLVRIVFFQIDFFQCSRIIPAYSAVSASAHAFHSILSLQSLAWGLTQCDELFNLTSADKNTVDFCHPVNYAQLCTVNKIGHRSFITHVGKLLRSLFGRLVTREENEREEKNWFDLSSLSPRSLISTLHLFLFLLWCDPFVFLHFICVVTLCECMMVCLRKNSYSYLNWNLTTMSFTIQLLLPPSLTLVTH